jgi:hypothetical protein
MVFTLVLLLAALVTFINLKKGQNFFWFDRVLFGLVGLLGIVIAFQWFGSDHAVMANNYNLIWAHPIHLVAAILLTISRFKGIIRYYFGVNTVLMLLLLVLWFILPQALPFPMFPLVAAMGLRSAVLYKRLT